MDETEEYSGRLIGRRVSVVFLWLLVLSLHVTGNLKRHKNRHIYC